MAQLIKKTSSKSILKLSVADGARAYGDLRQQVVRAGILKRAYGYYAGLFFLVFGGFFLSAYNIYIQTSFPVLIFWCLVAAFFSMQITGIFHDAGHRAIFASAKANDIIGYFSGLCIALVYSNWRVHHNKHHAHPNQNDADPDIEIPFSFTEERYKNSKGYKRFIRKYQVYFYYPLGSFVILSFRLAGLRYLLKKRNLGSWIEFITILMSIAAWLVLPFFVFDLTKAIIVVLALNFPMGFYLMNIFAPNHKGMAEIERDVKVSFLEQQIITSRNIKGGWFVDTIYMGLNYQVEHHLFPNCPRNKLKFITPYLQSTCNQVKLPLEKVGVIESVKIIFSQMHALSMADKNYANMSVPSKIILSELNQIAKNSSK